MKLTKRMKNAIIQGFITNMFFFLILIGVLAFVIYPKFSDIEDKKQSLVQTYNTLEEVKKEGISFGDFKTNVNSSDLMKDSYSKNIVKNITKSFYDENFTNTGSQDFNLFLDSLQQNILEKKSSPEYMKKDETLGLILPVYDEKNTFSDEGLSDFFFINYIENILYSFNVSSSGDIGIGSLEKQGNTEQEGDQKKSLQEDIYAIPLTLEIVGQKKDVIEFIHYFENVGGVKVSENDIDIYSDTFIAKRLEGDSSVRDYNIYKNQISDIQSLSLQDYPDSSSLKTQGLISAMRGSQAREKITVELEIFFYVAGVPGYKIEEYINDFLTLYQELSAQISQDAKKYTTQAANYKNGEELLAINNLQSLQAIVSTLEEDVKKVRIALAKRDNIDATYNLAVEYNDQLMQIQKSYNKQINILTQ